MSHWRRGGHFNRTQDILQRNQSGTCKGASTYWAPNTRHCEASYFLHSKVKSMSHFIYLTSQLLQPLQNLTQQKKLNCSKELEEYFCSIKQVLSSLPTLMPPCFEQPFFVNPSVGIETLEASLLQKIHIVVRWSLCTFQVEWFWRVRRLTQRWNEWCQLQFLQ